MEQRKIALVYEKEDETETVQLQETLGSLYDMEMCEIAGKNDLEQHYLRWTESMPNMVITVNLAGFFWRNTGGNSMYSMLPVDTIHYLTREVSGETEKLSGLIPVTMRFLVGSEGEKKRLEEDHRRLHNVIVISDIREITDILEHMRWRRE